MTDIGKGLVLNPITKLLDVLLSTDSGNSLQFGSDNGLFAPVDSTIRSSVTLNLGSLPVYSKKLSFSNAAAKTTSTIALFPRPISDELEMDGLICSAGCSVDGVIDVYIAAIPGPIVGSRAFNLTIN